MKHWKKYASLMLVLGIMAANSSMAFAGNWVNNSQGWWYQNDDGTYPANRWFQDTNGKWYHFDGSGYIQTGWYKESGGTYYLGADGAMLSDTKQAINGESYTFDASGRRVAQTTSGGTELSEVTKDKLANLVANLGIGIGMRDNSYAYKGNTADISYDNLMSFAAVYLYSFHDTCNIPVNLNGNTQSPLLFTVSEQDMNSFMQDSLGIDIHKKRGTGSVSNYADGVYTLTSQDWGKSRPYATVDRVKVVSSNKYQMVGKSGWQGIDENGNAYYQTAPYTAVFEKNGNGRFDGFTLNSITFTFN